MKFIIDDANIKAIKHLYEYFPVDGVTTNPSILAKSKRQPYEVLKEIRDFIGEKADLHVQVVSKRGGRYGGRSGDHPGTAWTEYIY